MNLNSIKSNDVQIHLTPEPSPTASATLYKEKVEVLIPPNINDPLNLSCPQGLNESDFISSSNYKNNRRNRRRTSSETELTEKKFDYKGIKDDTFLTHRNISNSNRFSRNNTNKNQHNKQTFSFHQPSKHFRNNNFKKKKDNKDKRKRSNDLQNESHLTSKSIPLNNQRFQYGNYNRYYGYRSPEKTDPRIKFFGKDLFEGKDVLDIGCNVGHITLAIARDYNPNRIIGIDIDKSLIDVATKNIRHFVTEKIMEIESFPSSMPILYGPIVNMPSQCQQISSFPYNVLFLEVNYIPENDNFLQNEQAEYDTILCLSLTKWIHLNWGDAGVKRMFKRIFIQLRPGGCLILEPQSWASYSKKSKMTVSLLQ